MQIDCNTCPVKVNNCFIEGYWRTRVARAKDKLKEYSEEEIFEALL